MAALFLLIRLPFFCLGMLLLPFFIVLVAMKELLFALVSFPFAFFAAAFQNNPKVLAECFDDLAAFLRDIPEMPAALVEWLKAGSRY